ncbi:MAG: Gfo/Idh/MocA family oxidoreductase [Pseudomonadota bacterium]|nr:Gfo/Idh/MocA family oxidoreductase [Pseudomonadota bacterium]
MLHPRAVIVGLGVQGKKRSQILKEQCVYCVDSVVEAADFKDLRQVPLDSYELVLLCTPDSQKIPLIDYCIEQGKHVLVEKPLIANPTMLAQIETRARVKGVVVKTAYNHRFEPHFKSLREYLEGNAIGSLYSCRLFYGNGTVQLVRQSEWRDAGSGVLHDLGSHILDTCHYWFGDIQGNFQLISARAFENQAWDHVVFSHESGDFRIEAEVTLCSWRNSFSADIIGSEGSLHIDSLCKWGPSSLTIRHRIRPSGRPTEERKVVLKSDPTWQEEWNEFVSSVSAEEETDFSKDIWIASQLNNLHTEAQKNE